RPAVDEGVDRRDRLDPKLARDHRVLVDVDLDQTDGALRLAHHLLQDRPELLAGAAPGGPKIDDDRCRAGRLDDVGHEGTVGAVDDRACRVAGPCGLAPGNGLLHVGFLRVSDRLHSTGPKVAVARSGDKTRPAGGTRRTVRLNGGGGYRDGRSRVVGSCPQSAMKRSRSDVAMAVARSLRSGW